MRSAAMGWRMNEDSQIVPDSQMGWVMRMLPAAARDYASLARLDRPIGWWLLFWPCAWGVLLAGDRDMSRPFLGLLGWLLLGSIAMRGAGCVYNDIVDAEIDRRVARTALRPIASGRVSKKAAWVWLVALSLVGLVVLLQLRREARLVALGSLVLVAAYPFMKRITGWPQAWLGLVFTWGAPVGYVAVRGFDDLAPMLALYAGAWCWCVGYDTIYACQDREDDAIVGVGSSALSLGRHVRLGVGVLYTGALLGWGLALYWIMWPHTWMTSLALLPVAIHLGWQVGTMRAGDAGNVLARFRSNRFAGFLVAMACLVVAAAGY